MDSGVEDVLRAHTEHDKESFKKLDDRLDKLEGLITTVAERQQKQIGFFAGVTATVTAIVTLLIIAINWLKN